MVSVSLSKDVYEWLFQENLQRLLDSSSNTNVRTAKSAIVRQTISELMEQIEGEDAPTILRRPSGSVGDGTRHVFSFLVDGQTVKFLNETAHAASQGRQFRVFIADVVEYALRTKMGAVEAMRE